jgi:Ion channel
MRDMIFAILLTLVAIIGTTLFHLEALGIINRFSRQTAHRHILVPAVLTLVITAHLLEILGYSIIYWVADVSLNIGYFSGEQPNFFDLFYFAAGTYSSLGLDDIMPHGALRLIVAIGSINGILLLAWSGAFLFAFADRMRLERQE